MNEYPIILTLEQAAQMLQLSARTVQRMVSKGKMPGRRIIPITGAPDIVFHIPEDQIPEVDAYIAERLAAAHGKEQPI